MASSLEASCGGHAKAYRRRQRLRRTAVRHAQAQSVTLSGLLQPCKGAPISLHHLLFSSLPVNRAVKVSSRADSDSPVDFAWNPFAAPFVRSPLIEAEEECTRVLDLLAVNKEVNPNSHVCGGDSSVEAHECNYVALAARETVVLTEAHISLCGWSAQDVVAISAVSPLESLVSTSVRLVDLMDAEVTRIHAITANARSHMKFVLHSTFSDRLNDFCRVAVRDKDAREDWVLMRDVAVALQVWLDGNEDIEDFCTDGTLESPIQFSSFAELRQLCSTFICSAETQVSNWIDSPTSSSKTESSDISGVT